MSRFKILAMGVLVAGLLAGCSEAAAPQATPTASSSDGGASAPAESSQTQSGGAVNASTQASGTGGSGGAGGSAASEEPFTENWRFVWLHADYEPSSDGTYKVRVNGVVKNETSTTLDISDMPELSVNGVKATLVRYDPILANNYVAPAVSEDEGADDGFTYDSSSSDNVTTVRAKGETEFFYTVVLTEKPTSFVASTPNMSVTGSAANWHYGDYKFTRGDEAEFVQAVADRLAGFKVDGYVTSDSSGTMIDGINRANAISVSEPTFTRDADGYITGVSMDIRNNTKTTTAGTVKLGVRFLNSSCQALRYFENADGSGDMQSGAIAETSGPLDGGATATLTVPVSGFVSDRFGHVQYVLADGSIAAVDASGVQYNENGYQMYEVTAEDGSKKQFFVDELEGNLYVVNADGDFRVDLEDKKGEPYNRYMLLSMPKTYRNAYLEKQTAEGKGLMTVPGNATPVTPDLTTAQPLLLSHVVNSVSTSDIVVDF